MAQKGLTQASKDGSPTKPFPMQRLDFSFPSREVIPATVKPTLLLKFAWLQTTSKLHAHKPVPHMACSLETPPMRHVQLPVASPFDQQCSRKSQAPHRPMVELAPTPNKPAGQHRQPATDLSPHAQTASPSSTPTSKLRPWPTSSPCHTSPPHPCTHAQIVSRAPHQPPVATDRKSTRLNSSHRP